MTTAKPKDIDEYIAGFPPETREILEQIRTTIREVVPEAEETISYGIPTFNLNGTYLIYFAAYKKHIGLYPVPSAIDEIDEEFASYKTSGKGTLQFPLNKQVPLHLITKLVKFKVKENIEKLKKQNQAKKTTNR
jgi:uncharacterized protein YdhG (YjbR/CyaY superfamily)